ncbi:MAG: hypothetical protein JWN58_2254 [Gammaproteobacteria bacterium]|jgi:hypothetical protein|nr:hypothetical protein [Gammaproteobacteria bacterium]
MNVMKWMLASDPAIKWQVLRDLTHEGDQAVAIERARVATEGWGARLLGLQSARGHWGGRDDPGWMSTVWSLALLKDLGADPESDEVRRAVGRVRKHITWHQHEGCGPYFDGETEPCINGAILATGAYFGEPSKRLLERLLSEQLEDGGWNCDAPKSEHASFHTTICVLEGLLEYEKAQGPSTATGEARARAENYLLERHLFRSLRSGEPIDPRWMRFAFPARCFYDVLRGLDYLQRAGVEPDKRAAEAIEIVTKRRHQNGRWPLNYDTAGRKNPHARLQPHLIPFEMEPGAGRASHWNTLRALRVLDWYQSGAARRAS